MKERIECRRGAPQTTHGDPVLLDAVVRRLSLPAGGCVLDVGGGRGELARALFERHLRATVVDLLPPDPAPLRPSGVSFLTGDAERLPLRAGSCDAVTCVLALHYLARPDRALAEFRRVLRPKGRLLLADRTTSEVSGQRRRQNRIERLRNPDATAVRSPCELADLLAEAGFHPIEAVRLVTRLPVESWLVGAPRENAPALARTLRRLPGPHTPWPGGLGRDGSSVVLTTTLFVADPVAP